MRRFTSRPKRWVGPATVLGLSSLLLAACSAEDNGQNSLKPEGPQAHKIYNLFVPVFWVSVVVGVLVLTAVVVFALRFRYRPGQEREPEADPRQHAARDRVDDRPRPHPRRRGRSDDHHDLRPEQEADRRRRRRRDRRRQAVVVGVQVPRAEDRDRERAHHPRRPAGEGRPHRVRRVAAEQVQRDPQLLGPRAEREAGRRPRAREPHDYRGRQARHLPRPVRRVLRAVAREHAVPRHREGTARVRPVGRASSSKARRCRSRPARAPRRSPPDPPRSS